MRYIYRHWIGDCSLPISLAINFAALRFALLYLDQYFLPPYLTNPHIMAPLFMTYGLIAHGVVLVWQGRGLVKANERQKHNIYSGLWLWISYSTILLGVIFTLFNAFAAFQTINNLLTQEKLAETRPAYVAPYKLRLSSNKEWLHIDGVLALGVTAKVATILETEPAVTGIVLNSIGGQVHEGRGLAKLVKKRKISTYVFQTCHSACATAFIGGHHRYVGANAKLGFHQYGLELRFPIPLYDLKGEQAIELAFYRKQGISEHFISQAFAMPHEKIWLPDMKLLLDAKVVHRIVRQPHLR